MKTDLFLEVSVVFFATLVQFQKNDTHNGCLSLSWWTVECDLVLTKPSLKNDNSLLALVAGIDWNTFIHSNLVGQTSRHLYFLVAHKLPKLNSFLNKAFFQIHGISLQHCQCLSAYLFSRGRVEWVKKKRKENKNILKKAVSSVQLCQKSVNCKCEHRCRKLGLTI